MKTKPKPALRARKMFANYYPDTDGFVCLHGTRASANANAADGYSHAAVPVAVIPLDDAPALQSAAFNAYCDAQDANRDSMECIVAALTAIGVLPRTKKGRK